MAKKDPAAVSLGSKGGKARARNQTSTERSALAKKAAEARWVKKTPKKGDQAKMEDPA
jgi:hypothetical protein